MRKKVLCFALTCILMSIGVPASAQHEFVDLGLSVKWATCNVGADRPEDAGDLYSWGETETKTNYSFATYKFCVDGKQGNYTKYCDKDNKTVLDQEDDVAHVKWGGSWRMPTGAELDELREECIWTWTKVNGVNGYRVSGKKEGFENQKNYRDLILNKSNSGVVLLIKIYLIFMLLLFLAIVAFIIYKIKFSLNCNIKFRNFFM